MPRRERCAWCDGRIPASRRSDAKYCTDAHRKKAGHEREKAKLARAERILAEADRESPSTSWPSAANKVGIYLRRRERQALEQAATKTGCNRSELVRRAVRQVYGGET